MRKRLILGGWFALSFLIALALGFILPLGWALGVAPLFGAVMGASAYLIQERYLNQPDA